MSKKILIVDDEPDILKLLEMRFKAEGFKVIKSDSGVRAIEIAKRERPDLIVMDIMMPDMDGGQASAQLKEDEDTSRIPVIFLTGLLKQQEAGDDPETESPNVILPKPLNWPDLMAKVRQLLNAAKP